MLEKENHLAKEQVYTISPPTAADREILAEFSAILQRNFEDIFQEAHSHDVITRDPQSNEGTIQDIKLVDDGTNKYLVVKYNDGWYKTANLTAV